MAYFDGEQSPHPRYRPTLFPIVVANLRSTRIGCSVSFLHRTVDIFTGSSGSEVGSKVRVRSQ